MRRIVDKEEHQSVFHQYQEARDNIQKPIMEKMRRKFILGQYGDNYCPKCGRLMDFVIDRRDKYVEAIFTCNYC